jgi:hypothetical protein
VATPDARARRTAIALVVLVALLFVVEVVALATGQLVVAVACAALFIVAWFVLRRAQRGRAPN